MLLRWGSLVVLLLILLILLLLVSEIAACIAVPVSSAVGGVFHTVSEIADTFTEGSVTECEFCIWVVAFCRWKSDAHEDASLVVCEG